MLYWSFQQMDDTIEARERKERGREKGRQKGRVREHKSDFLSFWGVSFDVSMLYKRDMYMYVRDACTKEYTN